MQPLKSHTNTNWWIYYLQDKFWNHLKPSGLPILKALHPVSTIRHWKGHEQKLLLLLQNTMAKHSPQPATMSSEIFLNLGNETHIRKMLESTIFKM